MKNFIEKLNMLPKQIIFVLGSVLLNILIFTAFRITFTPFGIFSIDSAKCALFIMIHIICFPLLWFQSTHKNNPYKLEKIIGTFKKFTGALLRIDIHQSIAGNLRICC